MPYAYSAGMVLVFHKEQVMKRVGLLFVPFVFLAACHNPDRVAVLTADENGAVFGTLPDGTEVQNQEEYEAGIAAQVGSVEEMQPIALTVTTKTPDGGAPGLTIGKFRISIAPDSNYLDGCVRKKFMHLKIMIENSSVPAALVELHIVAWFESSKPCFAVMNTGFIGYGWCYKICVEKPKTGLKNGIKGGLVAAGVGATVAAIMSALITPVAATALAL